MLNNASHANDSSSAAITPAVHQTAVPDPIKIDPEAFYLESAAAAIIGCSVDTMRRNRRVRSDVPYCRYGRRVFYQGADLISMLTADRNAA